MYKRILYAFLALMLAAIACNSPTNQAAQNDPNAILTAAAQTVAAQLTAGAPTATVTSTPGGPSNTLAPLPTATLTGVPAVIPTVSAPTSTGTCDQALFITDVTVPDGTNFAPDTNFTKTWRFKNTGTCSWTPSYSVAFFSGNSMSGPAAISLPGNVDPGNTVDISVNLKSPSSNGNYTGYWKLRNAAGVAFTQMYVTIKVGGGGSSDGGGGVFAVTHVNVSVSGGCGHFHITADITTNGAGTVTYHWIWSDGGIDTASHAPLEYSDAGTKSVSTDWSTTYPGSKWVDIYIDTPNHQQFGRANFSCP
jgi:hypothetical protein